MSKSPDYFEERIRRYIPCYEEMVDSLLDCLPIISNRSFRVLELGCGLGSLSRKILEQRAVAGLTAVEGDTKAAEICRERLKEYKERVEIICFDPSCFVRPDSYDYVLSNLRVHLLRTSPEKKAACRNAYRSLRPEGIFSFSAAFVYDCRESNERIWKCWEQDALENGVSSREIREWHKDYFPAGLRASPTQWLGWLKEARFNRCELVWCETIFGTFRAAKN